MIFLKDHFLDAAQVFLNISVSLLLAVQFVFQLVYALLQLLDDLFAAFQSIHFGQIKRDRNFEGIYKINN